MWGFLGTVSDKVYYSGVVFPSEGTTDVSLPNRGMVRTIFVHSGDHVSKGQSVALISVEDSYSILTSTVEGTVISTKVDNEPFEAFEPIISVVSGNQGQTQRSMLIAYIDNAGQRQRIEIATALAKDPSILIMDEGTSALDNISQHTIAENLAKMKCTRITIAHRMSTIRQCNRIIVLDDGKVAEDGSYDELMAKGGFFSEIIKRQTV